MSELALERPVLCVVGPTASGKSDVAQIVAAWGKGAVISADSMQIYRGMDIGTGKVPVPDRIVEHFGLDLVEPGEPYSASLFQAYARSCFSDLDKQGRLSVLCGGTGFYVRTAIDAYDFPKGEQVGNPIRDACSAYVDEHGGQALWDELRKRDPRSAECIHPHNVRRVIRAFEMLAEGTSYADQAARLSELPQAVPAVMYGLQVDRDVLAKRIDHRVDAMVERGLVEEVTNLLQHGFRNGICAPQAIGYKEIVRALDGAISLDEAIDEIKTSTRRYAKRQRTWFRKDKRIIWLDATDADAASIAQTMWNDYLSRVS